MGAVVVQLRGLRDGCPLLHAKLAVSVGTLVQQVVALRTAAAEHASEFLLKLGCSTHNIPTQRQERRPPSPIHTHKVSDRTTPPPQHTHMIVSDLSLIHI